MVQLRIGRDALTLASGNDPAPPFEYPAAYWIKGRRISIEYLDPPPLDPLVPPLRFWASGAGMYYVAEGEGISYEPFKEAPDAWRAFIAILPTRLSIISPIDLTDAEYAAMNRRQERFVREYGLPREYLTQDPRKVMLVEEVTACATDLAIAAGFYSAVSTAAEGETQQLDALAQHFGRKPADIERLIWQELASQLRDNLTGIRSTPGLLPGTKPRIGRYWSCDDLLTVMWQQFFNVVSDGQLLRLRCPQCGRPYAPKDQRQKYCDPFCRNRASQQAYRNNHPRKHLTPPADSPQA